MDQGGKLSIHSLRHEKQKNRIKKCIIYNQYFYLGKGIALDGLKMTKKGNYGGSAVLLGFQIAAKQSATPCLAAAMSFSLLLKKGSCCRIY